MKMPRKVWVAFDVEDGRMETFYKKSHADSWATDENARFEGHYKVRAFVAAPKKRKKV